MSNSKSKILPHQCRICNAPAEYSYFGVISCSSCKVFFRRNAFADQKKLLCNYDGQCEINIYTRHVCAACRLAKCFQCGMSIDLFRASRSIQSNRKSLVKLQVQNQLEQLPTLNLLESDSSLLSYDQWTLLSNLYNTYKESQLLLISQRLIDINNDIQSTNIDYQTLVREFLTCTYETTGEYLRLNNDLCKLSSNDRSIMLHNAADNVSGMGCGFIMHHCRLIQLDSFSNIITTMYGKYTIGLHRWAMKFIDSDIVIVKLAISLFAITKNIYLYSPDTLNNLKNPSHILEIQNKYTELTWKYLLYRYGHNQAVKRFLKLTCWLGALTILIFHAQNLIIHVNDVNSVVEQTELSLILDDADEILEKNERSN